MAQPGGDRQALRRRSHSVFGVAAASEQGADRVAGFPAVYVGAQSLDHARDLQAWDRRDAGTQRIAAGGLQQVGAIHAALPRL